MQASDTTRRVFCSRACSRSSTPGPAADLPAVLITITILLLQQDNLPVTSTVLSIHSNLYLPYPLHAATGTAVFRLHMLPWSA
jgi:hypothetical protein